MNGTCNVHWTHSVTGHETRRFDDTEAAEKFAATVRADKLVTDVLIVSAVRMAVR